MAVCQQYIDRINLPVIMLIAGNAIFNQTGFLSGSKTMTF